MAIKRLWQFKLPTNEIKYENIWYAYRLKERNQYLIKVVYVDLRRKSKTGQSGSLSTSSSENLAFCSEETKHITFLLYTLPPVDILILGGKLPRRVSIVANKKRAISALICGNICAYFLKFSLQIDLLFTKYNDKN